MWEEAAIPTSSTSKPRPPGDGRAGRQLGINNPHPRLSKPGRSVEWLKPYTDESPGPPLVARAFHQGNWWCPDQFRERGTFEPSRKSNSIPGDRDGKLEFRILPPGPALRYLTPPFIKGLAIWFETALAGPGGQPRQAAKLPTKVKLYPGKWVWAWNNSSRSWKCGGWRCLGFSAFLA